MKQQTSKARMNWKITFQQYNVEPRMLCPLYHMVVGVWDRKPSSRIGPVEVVRRITGTLESRCRRWIKMAEVDKSARHDALTPTPTPRAAISDGSLHCQTQLNRIGGKGCYVFCLLQFSSRFCIFTLLHHLFSLLLCLTIGRGTSSRPLQLSVLDQSLVWWPFLEFGLFIFGQRPFTWLHVFFY